MNYISMKLMTENTNIFLVGPMGAGKTTVGKLLAPEINYTFIDSDEIICQTTGMSIAEIFAKESENSFREHEKQVIATQTSKKNIVLATGGGAILSQKNRQYLQQRGHVIFLKIKLEQQLANIQQANVVRPLLQAGQILETIKSLNAQRQAWYEEVADIILPLDNATPQQIVKKILDSLF